MKTTTRASVAASVIAAGLLLSPALLAATKKNAQKAGPHAQAPGEAAMVVVVDAETGQLRAANADEVRALQEVERSLDRGSEGFTVVTKPDGSKMVDLKGRFLSLAVARTEKDGQVSFACVEEAGEAREFLTRIRAAAASQHRKPAQTPALEEK